MSSSEVRPEIAISRDPARPIDDGARYALAASTLVTDIEIGELDPFRIGRGRAAAWQQIDLGDDAEIVYQGRGWVGGDFVRVVCRRFRSVYELEVEGAGRFLVDVGGERIAGPVAGAGGRRARYALLGPCLCLALALRSTFSLHASAVLVGRGAALFLGESGAGKSSLAAAAPVADRRRVADDTLPLAEIGGGFWVLPRFPQLKLEAGEQWPLEAPERIGIAAIYRLERGAASDQPRVRQLSARDATLSLLRHSVAARLFDGELRTRHLGFASDLAAQRGVCELLVPDGLANLPSVLSAVERDLDQR